MDWHRPSDVVVTAGAYAISLVMIPVAIAVLGRLQCKVSPSALLLIVGFSVAIMSLYLSIYLGVYFQFFFYAFRNQLDRLTIPENGAFCWLIGDGFCNMIIPFYCFVLGALLMFVVQAMVPPKKYVTIFCPPDSRIVLHPPTAGVGEASTKAVAGAPRDMGGSVLLDVPAVA